LTPWQRQRRLHRRPIAPDAVREPDQFGDPTALRDLQPRCQCGGVVSADQRLEIPRKRLHAAALGTAVAEVFQIALLVRIEIGGLPQQ